MPISSVVIAVVPAEDDAHHDGRRIERQPHGRAALDQKNDSGKRARLRVEPALEILVGRIYARFVEDGDGGRAQNHHRDRQAEVELHEAHAVDVSLAGGGDERDRAGLGRHDREAHRVPRHCLAGKQIVAGGCAAAPPPEPEAGDRDYGRDHHDPVERRHVSGSCEISRKRVEKDDQQRTASPARRYRHSATSRVWAAVRCRRLPAAV